MKFCGVAVIALLLFGSFENEGLAQSRIQKALNEEPDWKWSRLALSDGTTLEGMAWYNTKSGGLMFRDNGVTTTYSANNVAAFEIQDKTTAKTKTFYSLECTRCEYNMNGFEFYEVLKESGKFSIVATTTRNQTTNLNQTISRGGRNQYGKYRSGVTVFQVEIICFVNEDGVLEPYSQRTESERNELIRKYSREHYDALMKFVKEKKLSLKEKNDLVTAFNYYEQLVSK
jgi:hypothetical protein